MVKEYCKKIRLYTPQYYERQDKLLRQLNDKKKEIQEYFSEVKDVILDDIKEAVAADKRASIGACMTVKAPKTPGMTVRKTRMRLQRKEPEVINMYSPDTSVIVQAETSDSAVESARFKTKGECSSDISTSIMTPNRIQTTIKQTRLKSILEQHQKLSINSTPTSSQSIRSTRSNAKLLEQSLVNSTVKVLQFECTAQSTPDNGETATPTINRTTVQKICEEDVATPVNLDCLSLTPNECPANSTMVKPGTPAAAFGCNITLIKNTPTEAAVSTKNIVVSSPIGPISTTPSGKHSAENEETENDWIVSTGKRKSNKTKPASYVEETPCATPIPKRLQLSSHQPSPVPTPTPADKQPALMSLTIAGTPTPEESTPKTIFSSPLERTSVESADIVRTPNLNDFKSPGVLPRTPALRVKADLPQILETESSVDAEISINEQPVASVQPPVEFKEAVLVHVEAESKAMEIEESEPTSEGGEISENVENMSVEEAIEKGDEVLETSENKGEVEEESNTSHDSNKENVIHIPKIHETISDQAPRIVSSGEKFFDDPVVDEELSPKEDRILNESLAIDRGDVNRNSDNVTNELFESCDSDVEEEAAISEEIPKEEAEKQVGEDKEEVEKVDKAEDSLEDVAREKEDQEDGAEGEKVEQEGEGVKSEEKLEEVFEHVEENAASSSDVIEEMSCDEPSPAEELNEEPLSGKDENESETPAVETPAKPVRVTRSSRNKISSDKHSSARVDLVKNEDGARNTRSSKKRLDSTQKADTPVLEGSPKQGTVKKMTAFYEHTTKEAASTKIPCPIRKNLKEELAEAAHDTSKRDREDDSDVEEEVASSNIADESMQMKKKMKDNTGIPRNPPNLMTGVFSFVDKPVTVVKSAKELEEEKKDAARKRIEEKEAKAQQVLNKKKQRENELRLKRIEREKRMKQAKQNKEDEVKKKKAELEEKMKKKEEASVKEREQLAKKEDEKRQKELKKQEQAEQRRKQAEKTRELKKKKLQEEAEERKLEAAKRKQELEAQRVKELEKHRMDEEARVEEQRKLEAEEREKRLKADEERRKQEAEAEKKKTGTPTRIPSPSRKLANTTANIGTLLCTDTPPTAAPVRPPRPNKQATSKIPRAQTKCKEEENVGDVPNNEVVKMGSGEDLEEASNLGGKDETFTKEMSSKVSTESGESSGELSKKSILSTPLVQESGDVGVSPGSAAASNRIQSYLKNKLLSYGKPKGSRTVSSKLDAISETNAVKQSIPTYDPRDNYRIDDIESGDETDDESKPKRTIPAWARNKTAFNDCLKNQFCAIDRTDVKSIFGPYPKTADLDKLFGTVNKYKSRTSSAHWSTPPTTGNLDFSILTEEEVTRAHNIQLKYS